LWLLMPPLPVQQRPPRTRPTLRPQPVSGTRWPLPYRLPRPDPETLAITILRSSHKAGKTTPQAKSFKESVSRLGQRSQLAAPGYADSTKLGTAFIWGRWTSTLTLPFMALIFLHGRGLTRQVLDSIYEESNYFTTSNLVDVCKNYLHYEVVRSFLEWSC
jgi:hypothetical protein